MTARIEVRPCALRLTRYQRARRALALAGGWLFIGFVAITLLLEQSVPNTVDPEYCCRQDRLRKQLADNPDRPALVVVGSSRVVLGFLPEELPTLTTGDGRQVVAFNFSHVGAGPTMNRVILERLYRGGFRPRGVIIELMPTFLARESTAALASYLALSELELVVSSVEPADLVWKYSRRRLTSFPTAIHIACGLDRPRLEYELPGPLGGPTDLKLAVAEEYRAQRTAEQVNFNRIREFQVSPGRDRAIRESVELCRAHGAEVRFVLMPEAASFRTAYGPGCELAFQEYVRQLANELEILVIDARGWLADTDFLDSHHVLAGGATKFTTRLGRDVLDSWVASWNLGYDQSMSRGNRSVR